MSFNSTTGFFKPKIGARGQCLLIGLVFAWIGFSVQFGFWCGIGVLGSLLSLCAAVDQT